MVTKHNATKATLRQIAVLGLPSAMIRDTLASVVQNLVASDSVTILDLDDDGNIEEGWISTPEILSSFRIYLERFYNAKEAEAYVTFRDFFQSKIALDLLHRGHGRILDSEIYNEVWRQADTRYILRAALREERARGCIMLARAHGAPDFTSDDTRRMAAILPYLTHALMAPTKDWEGMGATEIADEGMLICNSGGVIEHSSPQGLRLLHEAAGVPLTVATISDLCYSWARPLLSRMIQQASRLEHGKAAAVPLCSTSNRYGLYVLRVWRLASAANQPAGLYAVSVRRRIPRALRLLQSMVLQALPAREKQVCLLLVEGLETKEIAHRLGIAPSTVISYIRALYLRVGVNNRQDLAVKLQESVGTT